MAPSARSIPAVSAAMRSALDPLPPIFVAEDPRREPGRLDRVVGADGRPVHVAPRLRRAAATPPGLRHDFLRPFDPDPELLRPQVHPAARRRGAGVPPIPGGWHDDQTAAVQPL